MNSHSEKLVSASDPATDPLVLRSLAEVPHKALQRALAVNPNTPADVLEDLWSEHPDLVLENPIVALWDFSEPTRTASRIGWRAMLALHNHHRRTGLPLREDLFTEDNLARSIEVAVRNEDRAVFEFIPFDGNSKNRFLLVKFSQRFERFRFWHDSAPDSAWLALASDPDGENRTLFAKFLRTAPVDFEAHRKELFSDVCRLLASSNSEEIGEPLSNFRFLPAEIVEQLSTSTNPRIRTAVTRCLHAPASVLERLAGDGEEAVRLSLARICKLESVHERLWNDSSELVRKSLFENHSVPLRLLKAIDDSHPLVLRQAVFRNPNANAALRNRLLRCGDPHLQAAILRIRGERSRSVIPDGKFFWLSSHRLARWSPSVAGGAHPLN